MEWIKCMDKMPPHDDDWYGQKVLVCSEDNEIWVDYFDYQEFKWAKWKYESVPVYWMVLPNFPTEKEIDAMD